MTKINHYSTIIIGSGPAGFTAAIYAARAGLSHLFITGNPLGGQLILTHKIENYPGVLDISGYDLIENLKKQVNSLGVKQLHASVTHLNLSKRPFLITTNDNISFTSDTLILALGSSPKWLKIPGEEEFKGKGVSICATCDGYFYRQKKVAIIGGGNSAVYDALFLSNMAKEVFMINKNNDFSAEQILLDQLKTKDNVTFFYNSSVQAFNGLNKLSSLSVKNSITQELFELEVDGVFEAIGTEPNTQLVENKLNLTQTGYILTNKTTMETSIPGVYACGDVQEPLFKQAIVAAGSGCIAAMSAKRFLLNTESDVA